MRPPLDNDEHRAFDRLSEALGAVLDKRATPGTLVEAVREFLTTFGEDWTDGEDGGAPEGRIE